MIKKLILPVIALFGVFASCGESEIIAPMMGAWQCTGVSGGALGGMINTPELETKALNLLSVVYGGGMGMGGYARTGSGDITGDVSSITGLLSGGDATIANSWQKFLSAGTFTYDGTRTEGTITMTSKPNGLIQQYIYRMYTDADGTKMMELREDQTPTGVGDAISTVTNVIGSLFGGGASTPSLVEIVYTYKAASIETITSLFKK